MLALAARRRHTGGRGRSGTAAWGDAMQQNGTVGDFGSVITIMVICAVLAAIMILASRRKK